MACSERLFGTDCRRCARSARFASVVRDLQPDVGMMLTTVGYTEDARIYAKEQGVVVGVLRGFRDEDWAGRVQEIIVRGIKSWTPVDEQEIARVKPLLDQQGDIAQLVNAHDAHFRDEHGDETESFADVLDPIYQRLQRGLEPGVNSGFVDLDKMRWVRLGAVEVAVRGFEWEIEVTQFSHERMSAIRSLAAQPSDRRSSRRLDERSVGARSSARWSETPASASFCEIPVVKSIHRKHARVA